MKPVSFCAGGDVGKASDDISLSLIQSCSHDHGKDGWISSVNEKRCYFNVL